MSIVRKTCRRKERAAREDITMTTTTLQEMLSNAASSFVVMLLFSSGQNIIPKALTYIGYLWKKFIDYCRQVKRINFHEYSDSNYFRNQAYVAIESYLGTKSVDQASKLKGELGKNKLSLVFSIDDDEVIVDVFNGVKVKWFFSSVAPQTKSISYYPATSKKYYTIVFPSKKRDVVVDGYLKYVIKAGKDIAVQNKRRKLYTNVPSQDSSYYDRNLWSCVVFDHPATFDTVAIDPKLKEEIISELDAFKDGKDYYRKIGKAWKRGYLLYGPPGTGKSSMIAAMANYLGYNIYDIELTAVADNTELRKFLIDISDKSIVVIEDIDCSLDLTGQRKEKIEKSAVSKEDPLNLPEKKDKDEDGGKKTKVTLSGLLNFIDGLWSASGSERIIIFTTNHKDKLDSALIRRGRMDQHIELSYCKFEAFKVLAENYLGVKSHALFDKIKALLDEVDMTPADVVEHLMQKRLGAGVESSLEILIQALESAKEKADKEAREEEEELKKKAKQEAKKIKPTTVSSKGTTKKKMVKKRSI